MKCYSQHEVLFPARVVAADGDRRRLDILQLERHVRVELVYNNSVTAVSSLQWRRQTSVSGATATGVKPLATGLIGTLMVTDQLNSI